MPINYSEAMREGFNHLREHVQGNQTASIIRKVVTGRDPVVGLSGTVTQVAGLADLPVVVEDPSERDIQLGRGKFDYKDRVFVFFDVDLMSSDQIVWNGSTYNVAGFRKVPGITMIRVLGKRTTAGDGAAS